MNLAFDLVVIGGGMAAGRLLHGLGEGGFQGRIAIVSNEQYFGYNRVLLPGYLGQECLLEDLMVKPTTGLACELFENSVARSLDVASHTVKIASGKTDQTIHYKQLVFATGSDVPEPEAIAEVKAPNKLKLRSLADAKLVNTFCRKGGSAVIIGGGLLGLETGNALLNIGMQVHVVHRNARLMNRQLDHEASDILKQRLEHRGFNFHLSRSVQSVTGEILIDRVGLDQGETIDTDLVISATGTVPRIELATSAGIACGRGITVDEKLESNIPGHYAIGECAEFEGETCGLVAPTHGQAEVLAMNLCGGTQHYKSVGLATRLKVSGIELFSAGSLDECSNDVCIRSSDQSVYRRIGFDGEKLTGGVLLGDITGARFIEQSLGETVASPEQREKLAFGL